MKLNEDALDAAHRTYLSCKSYTEIRVRLERAIKVYIRFAALQDQHKPDTIEATEPPTENT